LEVLSSQLSDFCSAHYLETTYRYEHAIEVYQAWLHANAEYYDIWVLSGQELDLTQETLLTFLSGIDVYLDLGLTWRLRFSERALNRLEESPEERKMKL